jgi:hypothetical protein
MVDISHLWGNDLMVGATGDLAVASTGTLTQQRVLRRLLTSVGGYIWQLTYGAGLPGMVGQPHQVTAIKAVVRSQIFNEASVAEIPEPVIDVSDNQSGVVQVNILYVDAQTGATQSLSFPVGN